MERVCISLDHINKCVSSYYWPFHFLKSISRVKAVKNNQFWWFSFSGRTDISPLYAGKPWISPHDCFSCFWWHLHRHIYQKWFKLSEIAPPSGQKLHRVPLRGRKKQFSGCCIMGFVGTSIFPSLSTVDTYPCEPPKVRDITEAPLQNMFNLLKLLRDWLSDLDAICPLRWVWFPWSSPVCF